jgi:hypothetical protein
LSEDAQRKRKGTINEYSDRDTAYVNHRGS